MQTVDHLISDGYKYVHEGDQQPLLQYFFDRNLRFEFGR